MHQNLRATATIILYDVIIKGRSLTDALSNAEFKDPRDQALLQALCYGVCRWFFRLDAITKKLLEKPLKQKDLDIHLLLLVGLYQLLDMRIPPYAAISETVAATKSLKKIWAKNLVNGVLRQYQRSAETFQKEFNHSIEMLYSHPRWIIEKLQQSYPTTDSNLFDWKKILIANNQFPPFSLRVNQQRINRADYLKKLTDSGITAHPIPETQSGIIVENPINVQELPGFAAGEVSVQDGAAQLAAELLKPESEQYILDACAAPGGKTAHILEIQSDIELIAVDHDSDRLHAITDNLQRLKFISNKISCFAADVANTGQWWQGKLFDKILLDAPCSASGVIRRHPDIKLLRRHSDIEKLAATQLELLTALWPLLKSGGTLLYVTCSIFPEENQEVIQKFLSQHSDASEDKIQQSWGINCSIGKQILPSMHHMDGFYFARLQKN